MSLSNIIYVYIMVALSVFFFFVLIFIARESFLFSRKQNIRVSFDINRKMRIDYLSLLLLLLTTFYGLFILLLVSLGNKWTMLTTRASIKYKPTLVSFFRIQIKMNDIALLIQNVSSNGMGCDLCALPNHESTAQCMFM